MKKILCLLFFVFAYASEYKLDKLETKVDFNTNYMNVSQIFGGFDDFDLMMFYDEESKNILIFNASVNAKSITTNSKEANKYIKNNNIFHKDNITFVMSSYEQISKDLGVMHGKLSINDKSKDISINVTNKGLVVLDEKVRVGFLLEFNINRFDFDICKDVDKLIDKVIYISVYLEADKLPKTNEI